MQILTKKIEIAELCKGVQCVDLGERFQTHIYLQILGSIQPRTNPVKFARSNGAALLRKSNVYVFGQLRGGRARDVRLSGRAGAAGLADEAGRMGFRRVRNSVGARACHRRRLGRVACFQANLSLVLL